MPNYYFLTIESTKPIDEILYGLRLQFGDETLSTIQVFAFHKLFSRRRDKRNTSKN